MKVTLDLSRLLQSGAITQAEHDRLALLGRHGTGSLLVNVLVAFGVLAVAGGCLAILPTPFTGLVLGALLMAAGIALSLSGREGWSILASICLLTGALLLGAGILILSQGTLAALDTPNPVPLLSFTAAALLVAALFAATAALARSGLLAALATIVLFGLLGSSTAYQHAMYELQVRQPLVTILAFTLLALGAHALSRRVTHEWERLLGIVARTSVLLVNLAFWVGSLWGDDGDWLPHQPALSSVTFAVAWALALAATALWVGRTNRWVLNTVTVFAGIHFYTQWFDRLGATPVTILAAGLVLLGFALVLWRLNRRAPA